MREAERENDAPRPAPRRSQPRPPLPFFSVASLLALRSALVDPAGRLSSWNATTTVPCGYSSSPSSSLPRCRACAEPPGPGCCPWAGVACENGAVTAVSLACSPRGTPSGCAAPLGGSLPTGNWTLPAALETIDLSANRISGPLPPALARAPALTSARLGHNAWTGGIPPAWGRPPSPIATGRALVSLVGSCGVCGAGPALLPPGVPGDALDTRGTSLGAACPGAGPECAGERTGRSGAASSALTQVTAVLCVAGAGLLLWFVRTWSRRDRAAALAAAAAAGRPARPPPAGLRARLHWALYGPPPPLPPPAVYTGRRSINLAEVGGHGGGPHSSGGGGGGGASSSSTPAGKGSDLLVPGPPPALVIGPDGGACVGVRLPSCDPTPAGSMVDGEGGGEGGVGGDVEAPPAEGNALPAPSSLPGEEEEEEVAEEGRAGRRRRRAC